MNPFILSERMIDNGLFPPPFLFFSLSMTDLNSRLNVSVLNRVFSCCASGCGEREAVALSPAPGFAVPTKIALSAERGARNFAVCRGEVAVVLQFRLCEGGSPSLRQKVSRIQNDQNIYR